jgi:hypothetical protein
MRRNVTLLLVALGLTLTAACGGGGRPSKSDVSDALTKNNNSVGTKLPKKQADCFAGLLVKSKVSDKALKALVDGDKKYKASSKDTTALNDVATKAGTACL